MSLTASEAYRRLAQAARALDPALAVDRGAVHWMEAPYPGVAYGLALGEAHALLFVAAPDIADPGWESRLPARVEAAYRYLQGFTHAAR